MMKKIIFVISVVFAITINFGAQSQEEPFIEEELTLFIGEARGVKIDSPQRVAIVNPSVADITNVSNSEVVLMGMSQGRTSFMFVDKHGDHLYKIQVLPENTDYIKMQVERVLDELGLDRVIIKVVEDEGKLFLMGDVDKIEQKEKIKLALGDVAFSRIVDLIEIREGKLVEISVEVLELNKDASRTLGFSLPRAITLSETAVNTGYSPRSYMKIRQLARGTYSEGALTATPFSWALNLLESQGKAKILSRPNVVCQSGKDASLLVGGEVPVITTEVASGSGSGTKVEYKEYGIRLNIGPTVTEEGKIQLDLDIEISEIGEADVIGDPTAPTAKAYPVTKRNIATKLYLNESETLAIGGLMKEKSSEDLEKFPWLADVPVLGAFFRQRVTESGGGDGAREDIELVVTLTPRIIEPGNPLNAKAKRIDEQEDKFADMYKDRLNIPEELQDYVLTVQKRVLNNLSYPRVLNNTGWEGDVTLKLNIASTGELKQVHIVKSSGYKIFDDEAVQLAKDLSYPPFPPDVMLEELRVEIPIVYRVKK